jgi:hypothetical protein
MISFTGGRNAVNSPSGELLLRQQQRGLKRLAPRVLDEREDLGGEPRESAQRQDLNNLTNERALLDHLLHHDVQHQKKKSATKREREREQRSARVEAGRPTYGV